MRRIAPPLQINECMLWIAYFYPGPGHECMPLAGLSHVASVGQSFYQLHHSGIRSQSVNGFRHSKDSQNECVRRALIRVHVLVEFGLVWSVGRSLKSGAKQRSRRVVRALGEAPFCAAQHACPMSKQTAYDSTRLVSSYQVHVAIFPPHQRTSTPRPALSRSQLALAS